MRRHRQTRRTLPLTLALLVVTGRASASELAFEGTLALEFIASVIPDALITGSGVATVNAAQPGAALHTLALAGGIAGVTTVPITDTEITAVSVVSVLASAALGTGTLHAFHPPAPFGEPQLSAGTLPLSGFMRLCLAIAPLCEIGVTLPLSIESGQTGVGVGGLLTVGGVAGAVRISVEASPWTVRTATQLFYTQSSTLFLTRAGFRHGPYLLSGSTALPGGALQLVTPMTVTSEAGKAFASFGTLTLRFLPEPGLALLLGAGCAGLIALGRRRSGR